MSLAQSDAPELRAWWSPVHLWRQFIASAAAAVSCFLLGYCLIKAGFAPSNLHTGVIVKDATLLMAFGSVAIISFVTFDACWLAGAFGASWKEVLLFPLQRRFWYFAFAWVLIDFLFLCALFKLQSGAAAAQVDPAFKFSPGNFVVSLGILAASLTLVWIRWRLIFWPIHALVTGNLLNLEVPWRMTDGKTGSLFDLLIGLGLVCVIVLTMAGILVVAILPGQAFFAIPIMALAFTTIFRALQLAAFAERYRSAGGNRARD